MGRLRQLKPTLGGLEPRLSRPTMVDGKRVKVQPGAELYRTARWRKLQKRKVKENAEAGGFCEQTGVRLAGRYPSPSSPVVDHKRPHHGDPDLFWDEDNLQVVSKQFHDGEKQRQEKRGLV